MKLATRSGAIAAPRRRKRRTAIFISYRRDDASGFAGRLHEALIRRFGTNHIFRDIDSVGIGRDFVQVIDDAVADCAALVAIIGQEWLHAEGADGRPRIENPDDFVRREIASALEQRVLVIPVLVEGAAMPRPEELPAPLVPLAHRNAIEITDNHWDYDVRRLVDAIERGLPTRSRIARSARSPRGWASLAVVGVLVAAVLAGLPTRFGGGAGPTLMTGDLNIAVARFGAVDTRGRSVASAEAVALSLSVFDELKRALDTVRAEGFDIQILGPDVTPEVDGSTVAARAKVAAKRAKANRIDVLVYGNLVVDSGELEPEFFLTERTLVGSEELAGEHALGVLHGGGQVTRNPVARKLLRDSLVARAGTFADFTVGLGYYAAERLEKARDHLEAAERAPGWDERDGKEVLYLFLASTALKQGDLAAAREQYAHAVLLNPDYGRARLGLAEVRFQIARGDCEAGHVDTAGLREALEGFGEARSARVQPSVAFLGSRAAFGAARVHACQSQALVVDAAPQAAQEFRQVIDDYHGVNEPLRELAAESHAGLGFLALPPANAADAGAGYRAALSEYEVASTLTHRNERKAFFASMRGFVLGRLQEFDRAADAYTEAIRLDPVAAGEQQWEPRRQALVERRQP